MLCLCTSSTSMDDVRPPWEDGGAHWTSSFCPWSGDQEGAQTQGEIGAGAHGSKHGILLEHVARLEASVVLRSFSSEQLRLRVCSFLSSSGVHYESQSMCQVWQYICRLSHRAGTSRHFMDQKHAQDKCTQTTSGNFCAQDLGDWQTYCARFTDAQTRVACQNVPEDTRIEWYLAPGLLAKRV